MGKFRYILGIVIGVAGIIIGLYGAITTEEAEYFFIPYGIGAIVANLIWFDGPVIAVAKLGFALCATVFSFFLGTGIGCLILIFAPIGITICAGVITITLVAVGVVALVMFPINVFTLRDAIY